MFNGFSKFVVLTKNKAFIGSNAGFGIWTNRLLKWEGGYGNRPYYEDAGGETNKGVTWVAYQELSKEAGLNPSHSSFMNLTDSGALKIAKVFWNRYGGSISYDPIAIQIVYAHWGSLVFGLDMVKYLQKLLGVYKDGGVGKNSRAAIDKLSNSQKQNIAQKLLTFRWNYLKSLPNAKYNPGWFGQAFTDLKNMVTTTEKSSSFAFAIPLLLLSTLIYIKK